MEPESIIKKVGRKPGKTVAIFAGIHGNEKVGILTLDKMIPEIEVEAGTVYFVYANPRAINKGVRALEKNLNRLFSRDKAGDAYEDARARELMDILDKCDALLDIHSYNSPDGGAFAISEKSGLDILRNMDFPIIAQGFSRLGDGTDGYMEKSGKIGICIECGTTNRYKDFLNLAESSAHQFLQYFGCIDPKVANADTKQRLFTVKRIIHKDTSGFRFTREFRDFDILPTGEPFATDDAAVHFASRDEAIIFPRPDVPIGGEACIIGSFAADTSS